MENLILLFIFLMYGALLAWEAIWPARTLPKVPFWRLRGAAFFGVYFALALHLPFLWDAVLAEHRLMDISSWGTLASALVGFIVLELGIYAWHRALHGSEFLWRWFHQTHHSSERHDAWGALVFSPLDTVGFTFVSSYSLVGIVGLDPMGAVMASLLATFMAFFTHTNVRTPRWLGYLVQRPEAHAVHHERGVHFYNFSDLPVIDMIFGTFRNPDCFPEVQGFVPGTSGRLVALLTGRRVPQ